MWSLKEALVFVRSINPYCSTVGWYPNIGGGVLIKGSSDHDLDIVFIPRLPGITLDQLHITLRALGLNMVRDANTVRKGWKDPDTKHVEEWRTKDNKRIDVIVMGDFKYY